MRSADDLTAVARIRDAAIEQFGQHGFSVGLRAIAEAAGRQRRAGDPPLRLQGGPAQGVRRLHRRGDPQAKTESIQSTDPAAWFAQMAEIESYAPMMAYLVRSMQSGGELAKTLWRA